MRDCVYVSIILKKSDVQLSFESFCCGVDRIEKYNNYKCGFQCKTFSISGFKFTTL